MLEWLRRSPRDMPMLELGGRSVPVVIRRLPQARRMTMRLASDGSEVRLSIPRWGQTQDALAFAKGRMDWLERQMAALPAQLTIGPESLLPYRGEQLRIYHAAKALRTPALQDGAIRLGGPEHSIAPRLRRWLEKQALALLADDLEFYCERAGQVVPKLALSNARRRWGSCAGNRMIRINWRLIMAPDFVRRSVVAHEVAHLVHFDHSPRFHSLLGEIYDGDMDAANHWLKAEGRGLYRFFN